MKQIIKTSPTKKKKIPLKLIFVLFGLLMILTITIGSYYYLINKPQKEEPKIIPCCQQETNELSSLETKIKTLQEELKQANLTPEVKTNLEEIIKKLEEQKTNLKNVVTFQMYMNNLEKEIQACEKELKDNEAKKETSLAKKHHLEDKKLKKEKELLNLKEKQKLFSEKDDLQNHILKDIKEKLKKTALTASDKNTLEQEKTKLETKITEINQEITKLITKMKFTNKIDALTEEIEREKDESLKQLLVQRKELCQKQLETLN